MQARALAAASDFRTVFEDNFGYVWNSLRHFGVGPNDLEDLAHEVFLRVHERFDECDRSRPIRPWLFAFACRVAASHRKRARHRVEVLGAPLEGAAEGVRADDALIHQEERGLALQALERVDEERRAVFILHDVDGFPIPEVAEALSIPMNTAYSRLRVARQEFAAAARRLRLAQGER